MLKACIKRTIFSPISLIFRDAFAGFRSSAGGGVILPGTELVKGVMRRRFAGGQHGERGRAIDGATQRSELGFFHAVLERSGAVLRRRNVAILNAIDKR